MVAVCGGHYNLALSAAENYCRYTLRDGVRLGTESAAPGSGWLEDGWVYTNGETAATMEYDLFGDTISCVGNISAFTRWFSTKTFYPATGLYEYLFRMYYPETGKWMNKDPFFKWITKDLQRGLVKGVETLHAWFGGCSHACGRGDLHHEVRRRGLEL